MKTAILVIVIAAVVVGAGAYLMSETSNEATVSPSASVSSASSPQTSASVSPTGSPKTSTSPAATVTITYSDSGYSPSNVTVAPGTRVTFVNNSSAAMWTASGPHPQHTLLPEFDAFRGYTPGTSYSFTFTKVGEWPFHNHLKANHFGKVIVR